MAVRIMQSKDELLTGIRDRVIALLNDDIQRIVNFENVYFYNSDLSGNSNRISIACIFINDEGNLCADMYRSGYDVSANFVCGIRLDSLEEMGLKKIIRAFDDGKYIIEDFSYNLNEESNKRLNLFSIFKSVFFQKSA